MITTQKKHKHRKVILLSALALLAFGSVGATFAYWASTVSGTDQENSGSINIGEGDTVSTTLSVKGTGSDSVLVPVGQGREGQVESVDILFTVSWNSTGNNASGITGTLIPTLTAARTEKTDTDAEKSVLRDLIICNFEAESYTVVTDGNPIDIKATIMIEEPADLDSYNLISGQVLELTFNFKVDPQA